MPQVTGHGGVAPRRYSVRVTGHGTLNSVVGLMGTFDLANYGDLLFPRIAQLELAARVPNAEFRWLAPYGWEHPIPMDGGMLAEPLGQPTAARRAELAAQLDALVIGGGDIAHDRDDLLVGHYSAEADETIARAPSRWFIEGVGVEDEARCPTIWHGLGVPFEFSGETERSVRRALTGRAYVSVRDERSLARLRAAGVEREIAVVPDSGFLAPRLFSNDLLSRRRALHHLMGWLPAEPYVVLHGNRSLLPLVGQLCTAMQTVLDGSGTSIVTVETGPIHGDHEFSEAVRARCPMPVHTMPHALVAEDIASVIHGSRGVVAMSLHASITAMAFQRPAVILNLIRQSKLTSLAELTAPISTQVTDLAELPAALRKMLASSSDPTLVRELQADLDRHFDHMAEVVLGAGAGSARAQRRAASVAAELRALRRAHAVRGQRLVGERSALSAALATERDLAGDLREQLAAVSLRLEAADNGIAQLAATNYQLELEYRTLEIEHHRLEAAHDAAVQRAAEAEREAASRQAELTESVACRERATAHAADLAAQLVITEAALDGVHRTKTFRLARLPRRLYAWLRR